MHRHHNEFGRKGRLRYAGQKKNKQLIIQNNPPPPGKKKKKRQRKDVQEQLISSKEISEAICLLIHFAGTKIPHWGSLLN